MFWYAFFSIAPPVLILLSIIGFLIALDKDVEALMIICAFIFLFGLIGLLVRTCTCKKVTYKNCDYNIAQMAEKVTPIIKKSTSGDPYLVHRYGLGLDVWVYYINEDDEWAEYRRQ